MQKIESKEVVFSNATASLHLQFLSYLLFLRAQVEKIYVSQGILMLSYFNENP